MISNPRYLDVGGLSVRCRVYARVFLPSTRVPVFRIGYTCICPLEREYLYARSIAKGRLQVLQSPIKDKKGLRWGKGSKDPVLACVR